MISENNLRMEGFKYGWKHIKEHKESDCAFARKKCNQFCMRSFLSNLQPLVAKTSKTHHNDEHSCVFYFVCPLLNSCNPIFFLEKSCCLVMLWGNLLNPFICFTLAAAACNPMPNMKHFVRPSLHKWITIKDEINVSNVELLSWLQQ